MIKLIYATSVIIILAVNFIFGDTLRVACIGNSITEGATLSDPSRQA